MSTRLSSDAISWQRNQRCESTLDTESEDELRALQKLNELDKKPSSERVRRRKTARSKQPEKWSLLGQWTASRGAWLVRPRQSRVDLVGARRGNGAEHHGSSWMDGPPSRGGSACPVLSALLPPWSFDSPACCVEDTGG